MTFSPDASQAAELSGIRKTLRTLFPPVTDGAAAMLDLLAAIERACARRGEASVGPGVAALVAGAAPPQMRA